MDRPALRRAAPADAAAIRDLTRLAYAKWVPLIGRQPRPMTADYDLAVSQHMIDMLEDGGDLLAVIEMVAANDHLLIENIAVRPDQQGRGVGDLLLRHADEVAVAMGLAQIELYTNAAMTTNLAFYAKRGFAELRRRVIDPGTTLVVMRRAVATHASSTRR